MTEIRGVTLDLDDTLVPQDQWLAGAWERVACRATALGLDGALLHGALRRVAAEGSDRGGIIDRALIAIGVCPQPHLSSLVSAFCSYASPLLTPYPGALDALARLRAAVPVVLLTDGNPDIQRGKITALGLDALVDGVIVSDELGGRQWRKPHAAPFRRAMELLDLSATHVVHVGDRPGKDVAGALGVGMRCVRVRSGEYAGLPDPDGLAPWRSSSTFVEAVDLLLREQTGDSARL